jgi:hypothetical protein
MFKIQWVQDFFELRRLRRDLRTADAVHIKSLDEISDLKKANALHEVRYKEVCDATAARAKKLRADLKKTKALVREQSGADLLVNALRELGVVPKAPGKHDCFREDARLQAQAQAMGQQQGNAFARQLGGLGGGII